MKYITLINGRPVINGTRIPVALILEKLESGETIEQILQSHPHLNKKQIKACIEYKKKATH